MSKQQQIASRAPSRLSRAVSAAEHRGRHEWRALKPAAILIAIFAGLALIDGLLTIGLFGVLEALGLHQPPAPPEGVSAVGAEISSVSAPAVHEARE